MRRIAILLAAVGALLLIPAAQALATPHFKLNVAGTGSGEVISVEEFPYEEGTPPIACSYNGTSASGVCENEPGETTAETWGVELLGTAAPGSELVGWMIQKGQIDVSVNCPYPGEPEYCLFAGETGQEEIEAKATFCTEGTGVKTFVEDIVGYEYYEYSCEEVVGPVGPPLTLNIEEGSGTVISNPAGLECTGSAPESCTTEAIEEGSVTLTASPAPGYLFKSWKKCDTGGVNGRQCTINLNEAKTVGVTFIPAFALDATKNIPNGIFNTKPGGVNCGYGCNSSTALYKEGEVLLKTKPAKHFHFVEYTGGTGSAASCNGESTETCGFSITEDSAIEEVYAEDEKNTLTLSKTGGGQAFIKTKPTSINCGYTCTDAEGEYFFNETALVSIKLNKGTTSLEWTSGAGTCTGTVETTEATCEVPMSEAHSLVADLQ